MTQPRHLFFAAPLAVFVLLAASLALALARDPATSTSATQAAPASALPRLDVDQLTVSSADYRGDILLVNFFASWCAPCLAEHPLLQELATSYRLRILGIAFKDKPADIKKYLERHGNPYHAVGVDTAARAAIDWGLKGVPETFLLDPDGTIIWRYSGPLSRSVIEQNLAPHIKQWRPAP